MNNSTNKAFISNKKKSAFLFLLAALMLVVSCPFKRLLLAENNITLSAQQSVKWNGSEQRMGVDQNSCCCAQKQKITLVKPAVSRQQLPAPDFTHDLNLQSGFSIHYFLNGKEKQYQPVSIAFSSSLPFFLQYRRLLI